jgi:hypothetical protein
MLTVKTIKTRKYDFDKMCRKANKSIKQVCREAGVCYENVLRANANEYLSISLETWEKLKKVL